MAVLPEGLFGNPVWHALGTKHGHLAVRGGEACRYPADVAPFGAVSEPAALGDLHALLEPGEAIWIIGEGYPVTATLPVQDTLQCLQMVLHEDAALPDSTVDLLSDRDAGDMVALTDLAFPGFFRRRTPVMGSYYGVRCEGQLIAMGGERLTLEGYPEISGVCTHPAHRGKGYAASLIWQLARNHRRDGLVSWLHVTKTNSNAVELYLRLGFEIARQITVTRIVRKGE